MGLGRTIRPYEMDTDANLTILEKLSVAVKEENIRVVESLLRECTESEKETILNPTYKEHKSLRRYRHRKKCLFQEPPLLFQALFHGKLFGVVLEAGANLLLTDQQG